MRYALCILAVVLTGDPLMAAPIEIASKSPSFSGIGLTSNTDLSDAGNGSFLRADDFVAAADVASSTPLTLRWWGRYATDMPPVGQFEIQFYNHSGSSGPGSPLGTALKVTPSTQIASSTPNPDILEFSIAPFTLDSLSISMLTSGTIYWISIADDANNVAGTNNDESFVWAASPVPLPHPAVSLPFFDFDGNETTEAWENTQDFPAALAFDLRTAVPEPSSLALLATGAFGFMGYGWRRQRKLAA